MLTLTEQYTELPPPPSNGSGYTAGAETIVSSLSGQAFGHSHALKASDRNMIASLMHWWLTYGHTYSPQNGPHASPQSGNQYYRKQANDPDTAWTNALSAHVQPQSVWESSSTD